MNQNINLNIQHYSNQDILNLFKIPSSFHYNDLIKAKEIVNNLNPQHNHSIKNTKHNRDIFHFFNQAYQQLQTIYHSKPSNNNNMNLNINEYSMEDITNLFQIPLLFNANDLARAKKIVSKLHPDKVPCSKRTKDTIPIFRFFLDAYRTLQDIHEFRQNQIKQKTIDKQIYNHDMYQKLDHVNRSEEQNEIIKKLGKKDDFNSFFNDLFEKSGCKTESNGYDDFLKSNEGVMQEKKITQADMANHFEKEKQKQKSRDLIRYDDVLSYNQGVSNNSLDESEVSNYSSSMFSNGNGLVYEDVKDVYTNGLIAITDEDIQKHTNKQRNIENYQKMREHDFNGYEKRRKEMEHTIKTNNEFEKEKLDMQRKFNLMKQDEQNRRKSDQFWSHMRGIGN